IMIAPWSNPSRDKTRIAPCTNSRRSFPGILKSSSAVMSRSVVDMILDYTSRKVPRYASIPRLQNRHERLLRNIHAAHALHALLAFLLLFQQLSLARHVAAVALGRHVFAHRLDRLAGNDLSADRRLQRDLEQVLVDFFLQPHQQLPPALLGLGAMHDHR